MTTEATTSPLARLFIGGALVLAGALLAFALLPGLVGAQAAEEETPQATEEDAPAKNTPWGGGHGFGGRLGAHQTLDVTAELTGAPTDDIIAALQDGASLAGYAAEQGVAREELISGIVAAMQQDLDDRVAEGTITQERADELTAEIDQKVEILVDREGFAMRGGTGCGNQDNGEESATDSI